MGSRCRYEDLSLDMRQRVDAAMGRSSPLPSAKGNMYNAKPVHDTRTGETWDSTGECNRWGQLRMLQDAGHISDLCLHPEVVLIASHGAARAVVWRPDYVYLEDGRRVWEDYKPRKATGREHLLFLLWRHFGPGLLRITGKGGKVLKTYMGQGGA